MLQVGPRNLFSTYKEVLAQIEAGEIPKKYRFADTYSALTKYVDTKLRYNVYENANEIEMIDLANWSPERIQEFLVIESKKEELRAAGIID